MIFEFFLTTIAAAFVGGWASAAYSRRGTRALVARLEAAESRARAAETELAEAAEVARAAWEARSDAQAATRRADELMGLFLFYAQPRDQKWVVEVDEATVARDFPGLDAYLRRHRPPKEKPCSGSTSRRSPPRTTPRWAR